LTTPRLGLAILSYAAYNLLVTKADTIIMDMEWATGEIIGFHRRRQGINRRACAAGVKPWAHQPTGRLALAAISAAPPGIAKSAGSFAAD